MQGRYSFVVYIHIWNVSLEPPFKALRPLSGHTAFAFLCEKDLGGWSCVASSGCGLDGVNGEGFVLCDNNASSDDC